MKCGFCGEDVHMPEQEGIDYHGYVTLLSPNAKMKQVNICSDCLHGKLLTDLKDHHFEVNHEEVK